MQSGDPCECETWSLALTEERRSTILEKGMLRRKFESKKEERTRGCRKKKHNEEILNFHLSADIMIKSLDHFMDVECMGQSRKLYEFLSENVKGLRQYGRLTPRYEYKNMHIGRRYEVWIRLNWFGIVKIAVLVCTKK